MRRENFGGRHQGDLVAVFDDDGGGFEGDDGFSRCRRRLRAGVCIGKRALEIAGDIGKDAFLRGGGFEGENAFQRVANFVGADLHGGAAEALVVEFLARDGELVVEKFFEDQADLRGTAVAVEKFDRFIFGRKVRVHECIAAGGGSDSGRAFRRGSASGNGAVKIFEHAVNDAAQHARGDAAERFVDRDDAADFGGVGRGGVGERW